jgi:hypothetical protein
MRRIIFCPSESNFPEAEVLAKKTNLPINIGIFEEIKNLDFDQEKVQVIEVPELNAVFYRKNCSSNFHHSIFYENDFFILKNKIALIINGIKHLPVMAEKHKVRFVVFEKNIGNTECNIVLDDKILESFDYHVC